MDNQFSPTTPSSDGFRPPVQQPTAPAPAGHETPPAEQPEPAKAKKSKKGKWLVGLLIVVLLAAIGGVYYWQHQEVQKLQKQNATLTHQLETATAQIEQQKVTAKGLVDVADKAQATQSTSSNLLPGEVSKKTTNSATLGALYKPGATLTAVWIEYGTDPSNLTKSTEHLTKELGLGAPNTFVAADFNVTQLTSGTPYYYRVAATQDSKTIYSGVAGFTVLK
jgi:type II secretory pathway pseudopilin PulG